MKYQGGYRLENSSCEVAPVQASQAPHQPRHAGGYDRDSMFFTGASLFAVAGLAASVTLGASHNNVDVGDVFHVAKERITANGCTAASEQAKQSVAELFPLAGSGKATDVEAFGNVRTYSEEDHQTAATFFEDARLEKPKIPLNDYLAMAKMIDSQVGMEFSVPKTTEDSSKHTVVSFEATEKDQPASRQIRLAIAQHALDVVRLPKDYWEYLGVERAQLVDIRSPQKQGYFTPKYPDTIFLDPKMPAKTTVHEAEHNSENKKCGGLWAASKDEAYTNLNQEDIYIGRSAYEEYIKCKKRAVEKVLQVRATCGVDYEEDAEGVTADPYGLIDPLEDKAMVIETLTAANGFVYVFGKDNVLRAKGIELMGRMYDDKPELVAYFAGSYDMQRQLFPDNSATVSVK